MERIGNIYDKNGCHMKAVEGKVYYNPKTDKIYYVEKIENYGNDIYMTATRHGKGTRVNIVFMSGYPEINKHVVELGEL